MDETYLSHLELMLGSVEATSRAFLDALTDELCVIDSSGCIVAVNEAWTRFAEDGGATLASAGVGENYLEVTRRAADAEVPGAAGVLAGLTSVLRGQAEQFSQEYEYRGVAGETRWFLLSATSLARLPGAVISHRDVTAHRRVEQALRLSGEMHLMSPALDSFLPLLTRNLASALGARHAFVTRLLDARGERVRMLAHWTGDGYGDLFTYETAGTPCQVVVGGRTAVYPSGVQNLFPEDLWLREVEAVSFIAVPLFGSDGSVLGHLGVIDSAPIGDPSFAETTLRVFASRATPELERLQMESRLADQARLIENAPDAIVGTDEDFLIMYWNAAAERTYGWRAEEVMGRTTVEVLRTKFTPEERAEVYRTLRETGEFHAEVTQHRRDGSEVEIDGTTIAFRDFEGRVSGFVSINRDITARKQAESALRHSEQANQAILDAIPDMMFTLDREGRILSYKPAQGFVPYAPPETFMGKRVDQVLPPEVGAKSMAALRTCLETGQTQTVVYELPEGDTTREYEARLICLGPDRALSIVRNYEQAVTSSRRSEQENLARRPRLTTRILRPRRGAHPRLLVIDPDLATVRLLRRLLEPSGYEVSVASSAAEGVSLVEMDAPDLVVVGVTPPDSVASVIRELQAAGGAGVIILAPPESDEEAVEALRLGADDVIRKPISPEELTARVEAALRRRLLPAITTSRLEFDGLAIDTATHKVTVNERPVFLTPTEFRLLYELAASAGRVLTHGQLMEHVWGPGYGDDQKLLRSFVRSLRRKLGDDPRAPRFIRSVHGVGYSLILGPT